MMTAKLVLLGLPLIAPHALAAVSPQRQTELAYLLTQDCGSCHGLTLKGGLGPALLPQALAGKPRALLIDTILHGRKGTAMPPWSPLLSREDAAWLADRLLSGDIRPDQATGEPTQ